MSTRLTPREESAAFDDDGISVDSGASYASAMRAKQAAQREERARLIASLERENATAKVKVPADIYDFDVWTDDEIVDFYDSGGLVRPPPAGLDREGVGALWPCAVCQQQGNRDPAGRQLWEGASVEAATAGSRLFVDAVVVKLRPPAPDEFGDLDPAAKVSFDVQFEGTGKRENVDGVPLVRLASTCKTCGRAKGTVPSWEKTTDLMTATKRGNLPVVTQLAEAGADLEARQLTGESPAMVAANAGWDLVGIRHTNQEGASALALAALKGHLACVRALLDADASLTRVQDGLGRTPLSLAASAGHFECLELLCRADRSQVNVADRQGLTPLFKASRGGHPGAVKTLLDFGASGASVAQSATRLRDLHAHQGGMRQLREPTPDGADWVFSQVLNRRYRHL